MATTTRPGSRAGAQRGHRLGGPRPGGRRVRGHDRAPAALALPARRERRDGGVGRRVGRPGRREHHAGRGAGAGVADRDPGLPQPPLQRGGQQRVRAERARRRRTSRPGLRRARPPRAAPGCPPCCGRPRSAAAARRRTGAVRPSGGRQRAERLGERRRAVVEERRPHVERPGALPGRPPSSSLTVAAARGSREPCATATSGGETAAGSGNRPCGGGRGSLRRGCRTRSCPSLPTGRSAGPRRPRPASCRSGSRSTGSRRRRAG